MIDRVQELLFRSEFFLKSYERLERLYQDNIPSDAIEAYKYNTSDVVTLLKINAILYYYETVSCIASLLKEENIKNPLKNEISFGILRNYVDTLRKDEYIKDIEHIYNYYNKSGLKDIRNKIVDHKDLKTSGNPVTSFINFVNPRYVEPCHNIIKELKTILEKYIPNEQLWNDYYSGYYSKAIDKFFRMIKSEIGNIK